MRALVTASFLVAALLAGGPAGGVEPVPSHPSGEIQSRAPFAPPGRLLLAANDRNMACRAACNASKVACEDGCQARPDKEDCLLSCARTFQACIVAC